MSMADLAPLRAFSAKHFRLPIPRIPRQFQQLRSGSFFKNQRRRVKISATQQIFRDDGVVFIFLVAFFFLLSSHLA
jgi:hypothetical protein